MPLKPCLDCRRLSPGPRCPGCKARFAAAREARRGTAHQRGLGTEHRRQRDRLIAQAGLITHCPLCGHPITTDNPITAEHGTARAHGGRQITGLICKSCNSSLGATVRRR